MKVDRLNLNSNIYTSNVYLIRGNWNKLDDVNALIDAGADNDIISKIKEFSTGVGKKAVDIVIITHSHFDHTQAVPIIKKEYNSTIYSYANLEFTDQKLKHNQIIKLGDEYCQILHTPGHSSDSVSVYCPDSKILFCGDLQVVINSLGGTFTDEYIKSIELLSNYNIEKIYPGHGDIITGDIKKILNNTLNNMIKSNKLYLQNDK